MGKKAVLVGCNYPGTKAELKGCINDVHRMRRCLVDRFGFADEDIVVLIDTDSSYTQPTGANIRRALSDLVTRADAGDVLFFHYSGHGVRLPPKTTEMDEDDATGYDECIVPCDWNLITDDDFRDLVDKVPEGCRITIVSDSCHSGGLIDKTKEQIGESTKQSDQGHDEESYSGGGGGGGGPEFSFGSLMNFVSDAAASLGIHLQQEDHRPRRYDRDEADEEDPSEGYKYNSTHGRIKKRSLPLPTLVEMLKQKKGEDDIDVGKIRPTLLDVFGDDASPKVKKFMKSIIDGGGLLGMVGSLAQELLQSKPEDNEETYVSRGLDVDVSESDKHEVHAEGDNGVLRDSGILISGCQTDQESVDAKPSGGGAYGALSNAIQIILGETTGVISNKELVLRAREMLSKDGLRQRPGLYCSDDHVEGPFIC